MKNLKLIALVIASIFTVGTHGSSFKHITIDGSFGDWAGVPAAYEDPSDTTEATDLKAIYLAHDEQYLYVRFTLYAPGDPFTSHNNIFIDADNDPSTGFNAAARLIGSEMLIQSGTGYQEKNGGFNEGGIDGLDWAAAPSGSASDFEFRISRNAKYTTDGTPVFSGDTFAILLEAENAQFATVETAPDDAGLAYTFSPPPGPATGNQSLVSLTGSTWQVNDTGTDLNTEWLDPSYDDTQAGWKSGTGLFGNSSNAGAYPAPISTPLASGTPTYYLRTHFDFANDPASVILVASNYLSDGAVFYLNGVEAKRIRLPAGAISFNTAATGGPATEGQAEVAGFDTGALNVGDNVLAVELHQTDGDLSNIVFGMSLLAATQFPVVITDSTLPADRSVVAGQSTTFSPEFVGTAPLFFQWLKNGELIPNATNATYTIAQVLQGDEGSYSVQISNSQSTNVTSRVAVLTVTGVPVTIADPSQPADQTVSEGLPFTLSVQAQGSAPISYQWYFKNAPIEGATNDAYTVDSAALSNAGDYYVVVSNPVPSTVTSRTAHLTVNADTTAPLVTSVVGTPNTITLTFSEPVTEASATNRANYSLSGGLSINGIIWSPDSPDTAIIQTSPQTVGASYTVTINNVADRFNNLIASNTIKTFASRIVIDGSFDDWANVPIAYSDPQDSTESTDYKDIYIANDADYLYLRVTLHSPSDLAIFYNNIFIDTDNDPSTGYSFRLGSDMLVQGGGGYKETAGVFNAGDVQDLDWAIAPEGAATDFELRISRHAKYASDGSFVFPQVANGTIALVLEAENTSFATRDTAPDTDVLTYQFSDVLEEGNRLAIGKGTQPGTLTITWTGNGVLQTRSSLTTGSWQDVPGANSSGYTVQTTGDQAYFRVSSQ